MAQQKSRVESSFSDRQRTNESSYDSVSMGGYYTPKDTNDEEE